MPQALVQGQRDRRGRGLHCHGRPPVAKPMLGGDDRLCTSMWTGGQDRENSRGIDDGLAPRPSWSPPPGVPGSNTLRDWEAPGHSLAVFFWGVTTGVTLQMKVREGDSGESLM